MALKSTWTKHTDNIKSTSWTEHTDNINSTSWTKELSSAIGTSWARLLQLFNLWNETEKNWEDLTMTYEDI